LWSRFRRREIRPVEKLQQIHRTLGLDVDRSTAETIARLYFEPMRRSGVLDPDTPGVLARLQEMGLRLGVISNTFTPPFAVDEQLERDGIGAFLTVRTYSCQTGYMKPHSGIFRAALAAMGVSGPRSAYVGDRPDLDVKGARRVGMVTILKRGDRTPPQIRPQPDHTIERLTELPAILHNLRC
jgi:putative hydrolase of the HAD superfamily